MVYAPKFGGYVNFEQSFWNNLFEKELPKYKIRLETIFTLRPPPKLHREIWTEGF